MGLLPRTLRDRLTVLFAGATALLVCVAGLVLYAVLSQQLDAAVDDDLERRVGALRAAVLAEDPRVPRQDPYAQILQPDGTVRAASPAAPAQSLLAPQELTVIQATGTGLTLERRVPGFGERARLLARLVPGTDWVVVVGTPLDAVENARGRVLAVLVVTGLVVVAATTAGVRLLVTAALRPVGELTREAAGITADEPQRRLPQPPGADELAELARTLNEMLARLDVAIERERGFVDDASHELRTPLAVLRGELELGLGSGDAGEMRTALQAALREAERLSSLAEDLLVLARDRAGSGVPLRRERLDLREAAEEVSRRLAAARAVEVEVTGDNVYAEADTARLEQALTNLVVNADRAGATRVRLRVSRYAEWCVVEAHDDGPGFPPELLPSAFERFTRGDSARTRGSSGAGLGLAIVAAIARAHGGKATAANGSELGGARVAVLLPAA